MAELTVGQVVDGRYELEAVIGKGGMGCVFRAKHVITHGRVALKILTDTVDAELQQRFLAEARAASTIGHPAIVAVNDASRTPDGQLYLVMELLAGKPLRASLQTGLPGDQIRRIGLELLDALGAAHRRGIVHRDLKPENIFLLAGTGAVKVLDFGIAKVLGDATTSTVSGHVLGTIEYMAPEQLFDAARVDGRADLWAVGVILYELIAGVRPYGGATREAKYTALATEEPMPIEDVVSVSPDVAAFFRTALARDPAARFQDAAQMATALRTLAMLPQTSAHAAQTGVGATLGTGAAPWADPRRTMMPGTGTMPGAPSHPGTLPPGAMQAPPARGKKIALAGMLLAVAFGGAFAIVMATRKSPAPERLAEAPPDAAVVRPPDSAVVVVTPDAPVVVPAPPDPPDAAETPVTSASCAVHCKQMEKCGLRDQACLDNCARGAIKQCLDEASTCEQRASCYWSMQCSDRFVKTGTQSCKEANVCYTDWDRTMRQENICTKCIEKFSPATALRRAQLEVCRSNESVEARKAAVNNRPLDPAIARRCDQLQIECVDKY